MNGSAPRPATELMLTMRPRAALRRGRKAWVTATAPTRFTSSTWRSWSRGTSSRGPAEGMPALLTSPASGAPASARLTSSRARAMLAASVTSISTGTTCAASSGGPSCSRRTVPNTRKPRAARSRAIAAPMPLEAPVTPTPRFTGGNMVGKTKQRGEWGVVRVVAGRSDGSAAHRTTPHSPRFLGSAFRRQRLSAGPQRRVDLIHGNRRRDGPAGPLRRGHPHSRDLTVGPQLDHGCGEVVRPLVGLDDERPRAFLRPRALERVHALARRLRELERHGLPRAVHDPLRGARHDVAHVRPVMECVHEKERSARRLIVGVGRQLDRNPWRAFREGGTDEQRGAAGRETEGTHASQHGKPPGNWLSMRCRRAGEGWDDDERRGEWGVVRDGAQRGCGLYRSVPLPTPHAVKVLVSDTRSRYQTARRPRPPRPYRTTSRSRDCARPTACAR